MIDEIPIDNNDNMENAVIEEETEEVKPKRKGRPKGAVNKKKTVVIEETPIIQEPEEKPKPKVKAKPKKKQAEEDTHYQQQPFPNSRDIAAEVLHLLSNRHQDRANLKRERYRSWFQ